MVALSNAALQLALEDVENRLERQVAKAERLADRISTIERKLSGSIQVVVDPVADLVVQIPYELL